MYVCVCVGVGGWRPYLSQMMGRASCCWDWREEQGWRGGGAMGTQPSRAMAFRWENSGAEEEDEEETEEEEEDGVDDEEAKATAEAAGSGSRLPEGGQVSGPVAPCSTSPAVAVAACSDS